jgi:hypothetical protein
MSVYDGIFVAAESFKIDFLSVDEDTLVVPLDHPDAKGQSIDIDFSIALLVPKLHLQGVKVSCRAVHSTGPPKMRLRNSNFRFPFFGLADDFLVGVVDFHYDAVIVGTWTFHLDLVVDETGAGFVHYCNHGYVVDERHRSRVKEDRPVDSGVIGEIKIVLLFVVAGWITGTVIVVDDPP